MKIELTTPVYEAYKNQSLGDAVGNRKFWQAQILSDEGSFYTRTIYWHETKSGEDSKVQESAMTKVIGKNIGKSNETSPEQQAYLEIETLINKQKDKLYTKTGELPLKNEIILPMLAHKYEDKKHTFNFPVYCQPKFDGIRAMSNGKEMWSRTGKPLIKACVEPLMFDTESLVIDGELILPQEYTFQDSISAIKKFSEHSTKLIHRVYDLAIPNTPFKKRLELLEELVKKSPNNVMLAETVIINNEEELAQYHLEKISEGWEGVMIRTMDGFYEIAKRSSSLLKCKSFDDDEFEVVGVKHGDGKAAEMACLICVTKDGAQFDAMPTGTAEYRKNLWIDRDKLIGQFWTIKYFGYTTNIDPLLRKPRIAVALRPRDEI